MAHEDRPNSAPTHEAGWYPFGNGAALRYYDGEKWTDTYAQPSSPVTDDATNKVVLWALALGFGVTGGVVGAVGVPAIAFYFPLGFGAGGLALCIAAALVRGDYSPWWAFIAIIGSLLALGTGIDGYSQFKEASDSLNDVRDSLTP